MTPDDIPGRQTYSYQMKEPKQDWYIEAIGCVACVVLGSHAAAHNHAWFALAFGLLAGMTLMVALYVKNVQQ